MCCSRRPPRSFTSVAGRARRLRPHATGVSPKPSRVLREAPSALGARAAALPSAEGTAPAVESTCLENRHRCAQAARLRHRHLRPQPAAAPVAARSTRPSTSSSAAPADCGAAERARRRTSGRAGDGAGTIRSREQIAHPARPAAREDRPVSRAALRPAAADAVQVGRDDSRLHSPAVSAVPAEPAGYAYARSSMWIATHRANRVLTVSEASKRDILRYFHVPEEKIDVIYNAIDERLRRDADRRGGRARARALSAERRRSCSTPATSSRTRISSG